MSDNGVSCDVAVLGAGFAGLAAARAIEDAAKSLARSEWSCWKR